MSQFENEQAASLLRSAPVLRRLVGRLVNARRAVERLCLRRNERIAYLTDLLDGWMDFEKRYDAGRSIPEEEIARLRKRTRSAIRWTDRWIEERRGGRL